VGTGELVGQEELIESLTANAELALKQPKPGIVTVLGEAGHGKSHIASTLVQQLEKLPFSKEVIAVAAYESVGGAVDQTLRRMLVRALHLPDESPGGDHGRALILQRLGEQVGTQVWAAVALVLGWVPADHPEVRSLSAAPGALRSAVSRALGEALRMRARARPVAIVFDDAHLADAAVLDAFEYATLGEAASAVWVCVFARPNFERGRPAWGTRAGSASKRAIEPLDAASAATLARRLLHPAENVSRRALGRLYDRTRGVPRLLVELVRGLKREGIVRRAEHGTGYYLATDELDKLPDLPIVQWSASREVEALPAQLAAHARLASVLGAKFTTDDVEYVLDWLEREAGWRETDLDAAVGIQRLIEAGLVVRHRTGQIDFRHPLLRETVYTGVPEAQKTTIHRAAYEMYRASASADQQDRSARLAFHAARCGLAAEAGELYVNLARAAEQTHAYIDAEMFYDAALANLPESNDELVSESIQGRGMMRFHVGRGHDALRDFEGARTRARARGAREAEIDILLDQAEVFDWMGDFARSETLALEARDLATGVETELLQMRLAVALGRVHYRLGRMDPCIETLRPSVGEAQRAGDAAYEVLVIALLIGGPACARAGRLEEADEMLSLAVTICEQHGDFHHLAAALNNRMFIALAREELDKALLDLERVVEISREVGFTSIEVLAQNNLGECKFMQGRFEEAIAHAKRMIDLGERTGTSAGYLCSSVMLLARIELYRGNLAEARAGAERVRECIRRTAEQGIHLEMTTHEALLLEMVELGGKDVADSTWEEFYTRCKADLQPHEVVEVLELRANAAQRHGQRELSRACIDEALKAADATARILTPRVRANAARLAARISAPRISVAPVAPVKSENPPP
jgi:tetratricopeptide (TPR) repeat protein